MQIFHLSAKITSSLIHLAAIGKFHMEGLSDFQTALFLQKMLKIKVFQACLINFIYSVAAQRILRRNL